MNSNPSIQAWRVLYLARAPFVSGAERALETILRHADRQRIQPMVVLGSDSPWRHTLDNMAVPTVIVPMPKRSMRSWWSWRQSLAQLRQIIREFQPDLLHANDVPSSQAMSVLGASLHLPRVVHVRWGITATDIGWWAREGAELVLCISAWIKQELGDPAGSTIAGSTLEVLQDAVDWPGGGTVNSESIAALPLEPVLGFAGQLIDAKGLDLVIQAMGLMSPGRRPRLLVAGKDTQTQGAYESHLRQLAQQAGVADRIQWLGFVADVNQLYRQVSAMVCPSRLEPLGLVPLEASRWGVPTLASRLGGFLETIEHGRTGWLVEPSAPAWAQALEVLWDRSRLIAAGQAARERTMRENSPMVYHQRLIRIYEQLIRKARTES